VCRKGRTDEGRFFLSVDPEFAGEARKTALERMLVNHHSLGHCCWNRAVTRQSPLPVRLQL